MKKILCLTLILLGSISILAQEKKITQVEFDAVYNTGMAQLKNTSYRMTTKIESKSSWNSSLPLAESSIPSSFSSPPSLSSESARKNPFNSNTPHKQKRIGDPSYISESTTITEYLSPTVYRSIYEGESQSTTNVYSPTILGSGPTITREERITFGNENYIKSGNSEWKIEKSSALLLPLDQFVQIQDKTKFKFLGTEKLNGENVNVYQKINKRKSVSSKDKTKTSLTSTSKYWFTENGLLLKIEIRNQSQVGQSVFNSKTTIFYELDPTIKIEKPI